MALIFVVHWRPEEAEGLLERLRQAGHDVRLDDWHLLRKETADAVVISLDRLPAHGRVVGVYLRQLKRTRHLPLIFLGGLPAKVERVQRSLPDAHYTTLEDLPSAVARALPGGVIPSAGTITLGTPVIPKGMIDYQSPLVKKLNLKPRMRVAVIAPPPEFEELLGDLPEGLQLRSRVAGADLAIWFVYSLEELEAGLDTFVQQLPLGRLWVAWPKKAGRGERQAGRAARTGLTQNVVRDFAGPLGLGMAKICSIDATWTAMLLGQKRST